MLVVAFLYYLSAISICCISVLVIKFNPFERYAVDTMQAAGRTDVVLFPCLIGHLMSSARCCLVSIHFKCLL